MKAEDKEAAIRGRIKGTTNMADFSAIDIVIEAATEDMNIKNHLRPAGQVLPAQRHSGDEHVRAVRGGNRRGDETPGQVIGMHFANPVPVTKILEMVRTIATSEETLAESKNSARLSARRWLSPKTCRVLSPTASSHPTC
jgi:3-hydroxybutyryl-CoA dehydrogenase